MSFVFIRQPHALRPIKTKEPQVKVNKNYTNGVPKHYFFLNEEAVKLLFWKRKYEFIQVGIDEESAKICFIPSNKSGYRIRINEKTGTAQIYAATIIEQFGISEQFCDAIKFGIETRDYDNGGILINYSKD